MGNSKIRKLACAEARKHRGASVVQWQNATFFTPLNFAGVVQWQNATFPRLRCGSDSRYPLQNLKAVYFLFNLVLLLVHEHGTSC